MALLTSAAIALGLTACGGAATSDKGGQKLTPFSVAQNSAIAQPGLAFLWLGDYKQTPYYKDAGLNVTIVSTQGPSDALQRLSAGVVDAAFPPPAGVLQAAAEGRDLGVVTPFVLRRHSQYRIAVLPGSPIKTPEGIVGKKVGVVNLNDEGVNFVHAVLATAGAKRTDAQIVPVGNTGQASTELRQGHVDALALPSTQYAQIQGVIKLPIKILPGPPFVDNTIGNALLFRKDWLAAHKDVVRRYLRAFTEELVFFITNTKAALQIHFKLYPDTIPTGETAAQAVDQYLPQTLVTINTFEVNNTPCPQFGCSQKAAWQLYVNYLDLNSAKVGDVTRFYTNEFINDINSQDLAAVREQAKNFKLEN